MSIIANLLDKITVRSFMHQFSSVPDIRLVCLVPPARAQTMQASMQKRLEEFKVFLDGICQLTTCKLDEQELKHFLEWSELPWYAIQLSQLKRHEEYVVDAIKQYKQFVKNSSRIEEIVSEAPHHQAETPLLPVPSALENLSQTVEELQSSSIEADSVALAKELMIQLQAVTPLLEQWRKHLEDNKGNALLGRLHSYPKDGKLWWNYYSPEVDANSKRKGKRRYVRKKDVDSYRRATALGRQLKQIQSLQQQLATFVDAMRSLL